MSQEEKLLHYKEKVGTARVELSQLEGEEKSLLKRLNEGHSLKSVDDAKKRLTKLKAKQSGLDEKLEAKLTEIEENYEFD